MVQFLQGPASPALQLDPSGERPLKTAKEIRRKVIRSGGPRRNERLASAAQEHFGLPDRPLVIWPTIPTRLPWRAPEGSALSPRLLVSGDR
jgi:hypothetical protein